MTSSRSRPFGLLLYSAWDVFWIRWDHFFSTVRSRISLALQQCPVGQGFLTSGPCSFKARTAGSIRMGSHVTLNAGWRSNRVGLAHPVLLQTFENGIIEIGDYSGGSAVVISARTSIKIGRHVQIGGNTKILDHDYHSLDATKRSGPDDFHFVKTASIVIEDHAFIGANCVILRGTTIGAGAIIGAGAVVIGNIPAGEIWAGNPARRIKSLQSES